METYYYDGAIKMGSLNTQGGSLTVRANGDALYRMRDRRKLRQHQVEEAAGLPHNRLTMYEAGRSINIDHIVALSNFYGVPARDIVDHNSLNELLAYIARIAQVFDPTTALVEDNNKPLFDLALQ